VLVEAVTEVVADVVEDITEVEAVVVEDITDVVPDNNERYILS
jgi:hypothetical protein